MLTGLLVWQSLILWGNCVVGAEVGQLPCCGMAGQQWGRQTPKSHLEEDMSWHFLFARSIHVGMDQILHLLGRFTPKSSDAVFDP